MPGERGPKDKNVIPFKARHENAPPGIALGIAEVRAWTDRVGVNKTTVSDAEKEYEGKEIPELEALFLARPANYLNIPERWLALANVLEKKYEARNNKKKLQ